MGTGVSGLSEPDARVGIYAEPVETGSGSGTSGSGGNGSLTSVAAKASEPGPRQLTRGVLALRDFAPGEELFRIPLRLAITDHIVSDGGGGAGESKGGSSSSSSTSSSFDDDSEEAAAGRNHRAEPSAWGARLACRLLREKSRGKASPWAPWLSVLPTTTTTTTAKVRSRDAASGEISETVIVRHGSLRSAWAGALPREVAALLPCPASSKALLAATTAADAEFSKLPKAALATVASAAVAAAAATAAAPSSDPSSPSGPASSSPSSLSSSDEMNASAMASYRWARAIVQSRTFGSTAKEESAGKGGRGGGGGEEGSSSNGRGNNNNGSSIAPSPPSISLVRMLVPLADFVNHAGDEAEALLSGRAAPTANAEWKVVADANSSDDDDGDECDLAGGRGERAGGRGRGGRGRGRAGRGAGAFSGVAESSSGSGGGGRPGGGGAPPSSWSLVVSATRPLVAGEEVSFSYGNRVNGDFLASYGFVPPRNPHDAVCLFESVEEAVDWAARRLGLEAANGGAAAAAVVPSSSPLFSAAVAAAERETPPSLARAISSSRDPELVAESKRLWLWAGARIDERLAAALEVMVASPSAAPFLLATSTTAAAAGELVAARAAEILSRSGAPPLTDALGELERAGEHEHEEQHYFRALKRRYAAKEAAVRRSAARASERAASASAADAGAAAFADADAIAPTAAPAAPLPPPPPRGGSRSAWRGVRLMALRAGVYSTMILWDALEAADKAAAKKVEAAA